MASSARKRKRRRRSPRSATAPGEPPAGSERGAPPVEAARDGNPSARARSRTESRRGPRERPPAPWGSFPLVELCVLLAIVFLVVGFFVQGSRGTTMIAAGVVLGSLSGLELSIREHFAGFRSHTTVLAGAVGVTALAVAFFVNDYTPSPVGLGVGIVAFAGAFYGFRELFKRRSGGLGFR
jgi:hypothetical protein